MNKKAFILTNSLKDILSLFDKDEELRHLSLGDTWHPSSGFVDEKVLNGKNRVSDILDFDYDFKGLVQFEADIETVKIKLVDEQTKQNGKEEYEIQGTIKDLEILRNRIIEKNAFTPDKYEFKIESNWKN